MDSLQQQQFAINLMEHLVTATFVLDHAGTVIIWNQACERLTGIKAKEVIGTHNHWQAFYEDKRLCLADVLVQGRTSELGDLYVYHAKPSVYGNGYRAENWCYLPRRKQRRYLALDAGPIFDVEGKLIAVVETLRDMTEHKTVQLALEKLVETDDLTGLSNRRYLAENLEIEWSAALANENFFSIIVADIDYFKQFNDTYGHQAGDECLKLVAASLQQSLFRSSDVVSRFGGEEFCVMLPNSKPDDAWLVAERLRKNIYALSLTHETSKVDKILTISCGVASTMPTGDKQASDLIKMADEALYQAKAAGRNCTVIGK